MNEWMNEMREWTKVINKEEEEEEELGKITCEK